MVARTDQATDPAVVADLAMVRLGTASFRRALSRVGDDDFDAPSGLPGWQRRHLAAHVGYNARAISRLVTWAATGVETPMYASMQARGEEIDLGATLRPQALRSLCEHAAIELDVRWRDLPGERWQQTVVTAQGRHVPAAETLWMRAREVWLHAVDLDTGFTVADIPAEVMRRLLTDVHGLWARRGEPPVRLSATDTGAQTWGPGPEEGGGAGGAAVVTISGHLAALVTWATGRGPADGLSWSDGNPTVAPRWI